MSLPPEAEQKNTSGREDSPAPFDLDRLLVEAAEETEFDWPELLPVERIEAGITKFAVGLLLLAGLMSFPRLSMNPGKEAPPAKVSALPKWLEGKKS